MNNIEKLLAITLAPSQDIENALQQLKAYRFVDTAEGAQLDIIGRIVGQEREGLSDADYRRYIRAKIATNNSNGTAEDLLTVGFLVVYNEAAKYILTQEGAATARFRVGDIAIDDTLGAILFKFIDGAKSAGIRVAVEWSEYPPDETFTLDIGPGLDDGHLANSLG